MLSNWQFLCYRNSVSCKQSSDIERVAVVGDKKWEKEMVVACQPFTKAKIRYFGDRIGQRLDYRRNLVSYKDPSVKT